MLPLGCGFVLRKRRWLGLRVICSLSIRPASIFSLIGVRWVRHKRRRYLAWALASVGPLLARISSSIIDNLRLLRKRWIMHCARRSCCRPCRLRKRDRPSSDPPACPLGFVNRGRNAVRRGIEVSWTHPHLGWGCTQRARYVCFSGLFRWLGLDTGVFRRARGFGYVGVTPRWAG